MNAKTAAFMSTLQAFDAVGGSLSKPWLRWLMTVYDGLTTKQLNHLAALLKGTISHDPHRYQHVKSGGCLTCGEDIGHQLHEDPEERWRRSDIIRDQWDRRRCNARAEPT